MRKSKDFAFVTICYQNSERIKKHQNTILTVADLKRSEQFLEQMAQAMFAIKFQIGATGAISTSSALLADTANKAIKKKKE